jgi:hypothetical protein
MAALEKRPGSVLPATTGRSGFDWLRQQQADNGHSGFVAHRYLPANAAGGLQK